MSYFAQRGICRRVATVYTAIEVQGRFSGPAVRLLPLDADSYRNRDGNHGRDADHESNHGPSFPSGGNFPGLLLAGRGSVPGPLGRSQYRLHSVRKPHVLVARAGRKSQSDWAPLSEAQNTRRVRRSTVNLAVSATAITVMTPACTGSVTTRSAASGTLPAMLRLTTSRP
jgi:hypothetical protein